MPEIDAPWAVQVGADSFCQASEQANRAMRRAVAAALDFAGSVDRACELYAGAGNFTDLLLRRAGQVTAVERDVAACASLARAAESAGWAGKLRVLQGDVAAELRSATTADLCLLDPGRPGAPEFAQALGRSGPRHLVYVSCAFDTLARDAKALAGVGFAPLQATVVDAFAWTVHAEAIVLFGRG